MQPIRGMPLAIIACFVIGLALSILPTLPVTLAAFFLAVGLTCLTYSYLGGQIDASKSEGSGSLGVLSFKLTGSVVTFLVSFLFLNHHLGLSRNEAARTLSLESGLDDIRVEAGSRQLGSLKGPQLERWARKLALDDYFHPALIAARRPYCDSDPSKCVSLAGFYALVGKRSDIPRGSIRLCEIDRTNTGDPSEGVYEALTDDRTESLLNHLEVQGEGDEHSQSDPLSMKAVYADSGKFINHCRRIAAQVQSSAQPIRIAGLMNPSDLEQLHPNSAGKPVVVKINFKIPES
ncbi:MAG: hypothetical protein ACKO22_03555 [Cyanobium sp.]